MRTLPIALVTAILTIPSAGFSQDQGPVGGKVGPNFKSSSPAQPGSLQGAGPYGPRPVAPQERPGFAGTTAPGQAVPRNTPVMSQPGGMGTAFVNGHRVLVDPNTNRILRVIN